MKNLIISILAMQIVTGMSFWEYSNGDDRIMIGVALVFVIWAAVEALEETATKLRRKRKMQKRRAQRFAMEVIDMTKGRVS